MNRVHWFMARGYACSPTVAGTHVAGRCEGLEGLPGWFRDSITMVAVGVAKYHLYYDRCQQRRCYYSLS